MDYGYPQGYGVDWPPMEERNLCNSASAFGSFQHPAYNPPYPPLSWGTTDPSLLQTNENAQWLSRVKIPPAGNMHGNLGVDTGGLLTHQRPNIVTQINPFNTPSNRTTPAIISDSWSKMMAAISSDLSSSFGGDAAAHAQWMQMCSLTSDEYQNDPMPGDLSFSYGGDAATHAHWMQMCSLSSDEYLNDAMPQLISDSAAQQPYRVYTSSSDCLHEADSSGSSERDRPLSRSPLIGSSSDEISWENSDALQGNLGGSLMGFHLDGLPDDTSSIGADPDTLDSGRHAFSCLGSIPEPAIGCVPTGPVSWTSTLSTVESGNGATVSNGFNENISNLDPMIRSGYDGTSSNDSQPYKRQRDSYTLEAISIGPSRPALNPPLSKIISTSISKGLPGMCAYPMTSSNITDALYKDFHVPRGQTLSLPQPGVSKAVGGFAMRGDQLLDNDPRSQRKQNATSIEPQSVAARHRRKKISERVRVLEKLIPGGNKMDTASMLDESIEYVKFLQLQVQLLESLPGDTSEGSSTVSTSLFYKENLGGERDGFDARAGSFGSSHASQSCTTMQQVRLPSSPLILSEILQQQLFKQKLCLVSLRQYSPGHSMHDIRD